MTKYNSYLVNMNETAKRITERPPLQQYLHTEQKPEAA